MNKLVETEKIAPGFPFLSLFFVAKNPEIKQVLTRPYAALRSSSVVMSATYAKTTLNVTEKMPDMDKMVKYHLQQTAVKERF